MSHRHTTNHGIAVRSKKNLPYSFDWNDQTWTVDSVIDHWRLQTAWWSYEGKEVNRWYYQVMADQFSIWTIYKDGNDNWFMDEELA